MQPTNLNSATLLAGSGSRLACVKCLTCDQMGPFSCSWESRGHRQLSIVTKWILNCGIGSLRLGWSKMRMFWDCNHFQLLSASQPRTMMTILSTWAVCHLPLVKSYHLPFMRALPTCSQLRDFLSSCHFCCDSLVSCSVAVGPRTWQTWRCTSCFPPLVALHLAVPLPGLTRTDDSHVLRFFAGLVQKASHWSQWNQWYHIRVGITKSQSYFRCQLMSLRDVTVGCFLQLRLVIGQDTGKCTGTVWTKLHQPLL